MRIIRWAIILLIILLGISFASLNAEKVTVHYYLGISHIPISLLVVITLVIGILIGFFAGLILYFKAKRANFRLKKRMKMAEKEIANLRAIPLKDSH
jgi:lipopolysaccharide assembly protein A